MARRYVVCGLVAYLSLAAPALAQQPPPIHRVTDLNLDLDEGSSGARNFVGAGAVTFFEASDAHGVSGLWRTDGSEAGTRPVAPYPPGFGLDPGQNLRAALGDTVFVPLLGTYTSAVTALWASDGTPQGTRVVDLGGAQLAQPVWLTTAGSAVFFVARFSGEVQLWKTDGSPAGTGVVASLGAGGNVSNTVGWNGVLYFSGRQGSAGTLQLWRSDGTAAGTFPIGPSPLGTPVIGEDGLYFTSNRDMWRSDGTSGGTVRLTNTGDVDYPYLLESTPQASGGRIYFARVSPVGVCCSVNVDLYRTDESGSGFTFLRRWTLDGEQGSPFSLQPAGDRVFIRVADGYSYGGYPSSSLWVTDGTPAGTVELREFSPLGPGVSTMCAGEGRELFFVANDGVTGAELWHSDGTAIGTQLVSDLRPGSAGSGLYDLKRIGVRLYFGADDGVRGAEPWVVDAGAAQPRMLRNIAVGPGSLHPVAELPDASPVIFAGCSTATLCELYSSDGTTAGTAPIFHFMPVTPDVARGFSVAIGTQDGGEILFSAYEYPLGVTRLFHRSGPSAEPSLVTTWPNPSFMGPTLPIPGGWLFGLTNLGGPRVSFQLWTSDGTPVGTQQVDLGLAPIDATYGLQQEFYADRAGNQVLFGWKGATDTAGSELWRSDGTAAGTHRLDDLAPGSEDSSPSLFTADPDYHALFRAMGPGGVNRIYGTSGAPGGSVVLADFGSVGSVGPYLPIKAFIRAAGMPGKPILAMVEAPGYGTELWTADASGSPQLVKDIYPGGNGSDSGFPFFSSRRFVEVGSTVFFRANDGVHGYELWKTDGTPAGTSLVRDIVPGGDSVPANVETLFTAVGDRLVFTACDDHGCEPWVSDGTPEGTHRLMDVYPGPGDSNLQLIGRAGALVLFAADDGSTGRELWALRAESVDEPPILAGDLDGDGDVDSSDGTLFAGAFGSRVGDPAFNVAADLDGDGAVTLVDYQRWVAAQGESPPPPALPGGPVPTGVPAIPAFPYETEVRS